MKNSLGNLIQYDDKEYFLQEIVGDEYSIDPDQTMISRMFYAKYWGKILSDDVNMYDGAIGNYRGETIISFKTMAGALIRATKDYITGIIKEMPSDQLERLDIIVKSDDIRQSIKDKFSLFYKRYHSLSNFMPLVCEQWINNSWSKEDNRKAKCKDYKNLNQVKGKYFRDCPDKFYEYVYDKVYQKNGHFNDYNDPVFISEVNQNYFNKFVTWNDFIEKNYLQDLFVDEDGYYTFIKLSPIIKRFPYRKYNDINADIKHIEAVHNEIEEFLDNALRFFDKRAERLVKL